jgi:hypothetical protein
MAGMPGMVSAVKALSGDEISRHFASCRYAARDLAAIEGPEITIPGLTFID